MRELANILKINKLEPIPNYDKIELATIENWKVIVQKGQFSVGDFCVYCEYDTVLPEIPEFEFLRSRCYNKQYKGFRIRNMKMAGVYSQGIAFPIDILTPYWNKVELKEGFPVADILNIRRYDPDELNERSVSEPKSKLHKKLMKFKLYRNIYKKFNYVEKKNYPKNISISDETNIQKVFDNLKENYSDANFYLTEKLEGQAATFCLQNRKILCFKKREFSIYSHKIKRKLGDNSNWDKIAIQFAIEKKLRKLNKNYTIQGEIIGEGIQKNIYGIKGLDFYIYKVTESETGYALNFRELIDFCEKINIKIVPILGVSKLLDSIDKMITFSDGKSLLYNGLREGIVWRHTKDQNISFKAKSPEYDIWFNKKEK